MNVIIWLHLHYCQRTGPFSISGRENLSLKFEISLEKNRPCSISNNYQSVNVCLNSFLENLHWNLESRWRKSVKFSHQTLFAKSSYKISLKDIHYQSPKEREASILVCLPLDAQRSCEFCLSNAVIEADMSDLGSTVVCYHPLSSASCCFRHRIGRNCFLFSWNHR